MSWKQIGMVLVFGLALLWHAPAGGIADDVEAGAAKAVITDRFGGPVPLRVKVSQQVIYLSAKGATAGGPIVWRVKPPHIAERVAEFDGGLSLSVPVGTTAGEIEVLQIVAVGGVPSLAAVTITVDDDAAPRPMPPGPGPVPEPTPDPMPHPNPSPGPSKFQQRVSELAAELLPGDIDRHGIADLYRKLSTSTEHFATPADFILETRQRSNAVWPTIRERQPWIPFMDAVGLELDKVKPADVAAYKRLWGEIAEALAN